MKNNQLSVYLICVLLIGSTANQNTFFLDEEVHPFHKITESLGDNDLAWQYMMQKRIGKPDSFAFMKLYNNDGEVKLSISHIN